jgi:DNA (cytosine-5)-methyltransferase 1
VTEQPTAIDLYAGAGGATRGLKDAGFRVLAAVENDIAAASSLRANHPEVDCFVEDIRKIDPLELRRRLKLRRGGLTLLKACPPCQGYSSLGSQNEADERNQLVLDVADFIEEFRPMGFLIENVPGLSGDRRLHSVLRRSVSLGYSHGSYIVDATEFGVPQRRRRLIVIGIMGDKPMPASPLSLLPRGFDLASKTAGAVIELAAHLTEAEDSLHRARKSGATVRRRLSALPIGGTRFDLPESEQLPCHRRLKNRNATASYSRIVADLPAPTMTTRCTTPACGQFVHPTENRGLTLREAALLQTFPLNYSFHGTYGEIEKQIGNAVPVRMAEALGLVVRNLTRT